MGGRLTHKNTQLKPDTNETGIRTLHDDHRKILALFQLYLAISQDSRRATVDQIPELLEEHFRKEEALLTLVSHRTPTGSMSWSHTSCGACRGER